MSILLRRRCVVPTWFVVVGLVALSLRRGLKGAGAMDIQRMWHRGRDDRAALGLDGDAQDLMRMDSDKG